MAISTQFAVTPLLWDLILSDAQDIPYASFAINSDGELVVTHTGATFAISDGYVSITETEAISFKAAMSATRRDLKTQGSITLVGGSPINLTNAMIAAWDVDEGDDSLPLGAAVSSRFNLSLVNTSGEWLYGGSLRGNYPLVGATVSIDLGVFHSGDYDYEDIGTFIVEEASYKESETRITLTGSDPLLYGLVDEFTDGQTYPRTVQQIFDYIITASGITLDTSYDTLACNASVSIPIKPKWGTGLIYRQALAYVCAVAGSFLRVGRNGQYQIIPAYTSTSTHTLDTVQYMALTDDEKTFSFNRLKIQFAEKLSLSSAITEGTEEKANNTIVLQDNPLLFRSSSPTYVLTNDTQIENKTYYIKSGTAYIAVMAPIASMLGYYYVRGLTYTNTTAQAIADGLKTHFTGMTLRGLNIRWRGDPTLHVGDRLTLTNKNAASYSTCVFKQTLNYDTGFESNVSCVLQDEEALPSAYYAPEGTSDVTGGEAPAVMSASEILTAIKTVDGGSSGLDSQYLNSIPDTGFMKLWTTYGSENSVGTIPNTGAIGKDLNDYVLKGTYVGSGWTQGSGVFPGAITNGYLEVMPYTASTYVVQRYTPASTAPDVLYQRKLINGTWSAWYLFAGTEVT